jgi:succinylarginine dihydrolase
MDGALQGLKKALLVKSLGIEQLMLPPLLRPRIELLDQAGFKGTLKEKLEQALYQAPQLLSAIWSSSFIWTANLGHFTPYTDSQSAQAHFTPANLAYHLHRTLEVAERYETLKDWLSPHIQVHSPLPGCLNLADEGAANTTRLFHPRQTHLAITHFVYGASSNEIATKKYPARQSKEALEWIARRHGLHSESIHFSRQNPEAIDKGVFHNDVISTGHADLLLCHEKAFVDTEKQLSSLQQLYYKVTGAQLKVFLVTESELSLEEAVSSYFFNCQILQTPKGLVILFPLECEKMPKAKALAEKLLSKGWIEDKHTVDLTQSMANGGGPACLRLRAHLSSSELQGLSHLKLNKEKAIMLESFIKGHYPTVLSPQMLADPHFVQEAQLCHHKLLDLMNLPYDFEKYHD